MAEYDVVLLPSFAQVESWLKERADERAQGVFAQTATTFDAWIADLWELHGDGRMLVGAAQRQAIMRFAVGSCADAGDLRGMAKLGVACMRECAGVRQFEAAVDEARAGMRPDGLGEGETGFLKAIARYEDALAELGLVEPGQAAMWLAEQSGTVFAGHPRVLVAMAPPLAELQAQFFGSCTEAEIVIEPACGTDVVARAPEGVRVRFAFPSGGSAQAGLIADIVCGSAPAGDAVVACKRPLELFGQVERRLSEVGLRTCAQGSKPFALTDFGRAYLGMCRCLHDEPWDPAVLSDVVRTPFAGFSPGDALRIDASLRADRIARRDDVLAELRVASEPFSQLEELASDPDADVLVGVFEQMAQSSAHRSAPWRAEQLAAMRLLRDVSAAVRRVGGGIDVCMDVLADAQVQVSAQADPLDSPDSSDLPASPDPPDFREAAGAAVPTVTIVAQDRAALLAPGSCPTLVAADLTSNEYPVAGKDDAAATLLEKLGIDRGEDALARARRQFNALLRVAAESVHLVRPLGDENADATYPCAVLEEFVDAYREDPSATDDIDNPYRLPADLRAGLVERGEELLFANACAAGPDAAQDVAAVVPQPAVADLAGVPPQLVLPPRRNAQGQALARPCPSPSQVEVYLECPLRWFAQRRLRVGELDEGFGPLERGTFAHAALERFYRAFQQQGFAKVDGANIQQARQLMRQVLAELAAGQPAEEPLSGRLVPATELERREVQALCDQLVGFLDFEAQLLPTFRPTYFEYQIDADHAVDYAGFSLVGTVDRIDVDDRGRAVVIDYKGLVGAEYEIAGKTRSHAGKVQTRVYAQAVKRALGLNVVGALYVSYGRRPAVAGAYDPRALEAPHLPNMRHDKCACGTLAQVPDAAEPTGAPDAAEHEPAELAEPAEGQFELAELSFDALLDETERIAGEAVSNMLAGHIAPEPAFPQACQHCPVAACERRQP